MSQKITIEINGESFEGWQEVTVSKSLEDFCGSFSIRLSRSENSAFPIKVRSGCVIKIEEQRIITGFVEKIEVEYGNDKHNITVSGRDRTMDVNDSHIALPSIHAPFTLDNIAKSVLEFLQIKDIKIINEVKDLKPFSAADANSNTDYGMGGFDFIETYATKRNVLITTNGFGDIVFARASGTLLNTVLSLEKNTAATILESKVTYDDSKRFHIYESTTQGQTAGDYFSQTQQTANNIIDRKARTIDNDIRVGRTMVFAAKDNTQETVDMGDKVKWEANFRRSQSFVYTCTVQGFKPYADDEIWRPNRLVKVNDEFCKIDGLDLLIAAVQYTYSLDNGSKTSLKLMDKDSFTLKTSKPKKEKKQVAGGDYFQDSPTQHGDAFLDFARKLQQEAGL